MTTPLTAAEEAAQKQIYALLCNTIDAVAPGVDFSWEHLEPLREPGASSSVLGIQVAARQLELGVATAIRDRVVARWDAMGATLEEPRNSGVRAVFPDGYITIVNSGMTAVVIDAGSPPLPL
jgi:hypothetical protein